MKLQRKQMIKGETITPVRTLWMQDVFNSSNRYNIKILSTNQGKDILYTEINIPSTYLHDLLVIQFASQNILLSNLILLHFSMSKEKGVRTFLLKAQVKKVRRLLSIITNKNKYFGELK